MTPRAVLLKSGIKLIAINRPFSTARTTLNSAQPNMTSFVKIAHSNVKRPFERKSAAKNKDWALTVRPKIPTVGSKVLATKPTVASDKGNKGKDVKASARWIWKPKQIYSGQGSNFNGVSMTFKKYQCIDTEGRLKKYFKLVDDKHVLLRTPRQQNIYTVDLKNVVPHKNLTCLIAKALVDERFLRPFGCHVMILNTLDHLCKLDAKGDEGYFVGYSLSSKAFRVFNKRTKKIEEKLHANFLKNRSIEKGTGPDWLFDIDTLTNSMNYVLVVVTGTSSTNISGTKEDVHQAMKEKEQEEVNRDKEVPKRSRDSNPTASTKVSTNDSFELASSSTVETEVPTNLLRGGSSYPEPLSLGNAMSFEKKLEDFFRDTSDAVSLNDVEVDLSNMETAIQEEGIDYEEVFAPVARIEAIRLFLAYASYMDFTVYQMDVKSAFLYGTIDEKGKDGTGKDVELHLYRAMIRSLMYLTTSRPDIMFTVCAYARHQVTPKECHLYDIKRIFRYLKGHPKLGLWYPKESPFDLVAYSDSDYGGANQDRKSTTGENVAAASGCRQVLWMQNQLLDYGCNFMNTKIYIDNNSAIFIVKNPVYHSKTKHIKIRHHFIRDCYEKKLINVDHIHSDDNGADLLNKAFDVGRFQYLVVSIGMLNP
uniref:Uncharacterized protein n=1 Tax=Tanacetum cinerariifolium TaxID=118510 RepID=A0A699I9B5_TANCI|nr:hypothetical protein [Tanacetum cinerariifolium]